MTHHLRAALVFPSQGEPIADGMVSIEDGIISAVGAARREPKIIDLGNAAIIAGLVNAHAHLELTLFDRPIGSPGIGMAQWIELLLKRREPSAADGASLGVAQAGCWSAVRRGLAESCRWGVTQLADIASNPWPAELLAAAPLDALVCREIIAPSPQRLLTLAAEGAAEFGPEFCAAAEAFAAGVSIEHATEAFAAGAPIDHEAESDGGLPGDEGAGGSSAMSAARAWSPEQSRGLSLHAPYTVLPELWPVIARQSQRRRQTLAVHLAESVEEIEFMASGGGPLRCLLERRGVWSAGLWPGPSGPSDYLRLLESAHRLLIVHGGYLDVDSLDVLALWRGRAAVVFCPRTHRWFRRHRYPLAEMLDRGVAVAVGTDSRASSPDLNLWAELQAIAADYPETPLPLVLALGTTMGAEALGRTPPRGRLAVGAPAMLSIIGLAPGKGEPFTRLFDRHSRPIGRWLPGDDGSGDWFRGTAR